MTDNPNLAGTPEDQPSTLQARNLVPNPGRVADFVAAPSGEKPLALHERLPGYTQTALRNEPALADELGVGAVLVKHERQRMGLPAFKILGASWATYQALKQRLADHGAAIDESWSDLTQLREQLQVLGPLTLATATDGNHGRALARMAKLLGYACQIWVPANTAPARIHAIESEGATVHVAAGGYNQAVREAAASAGDDLTTSATLVVSDTSWPGYQDIPAWVVQGYVTIFDEIESQITEADFPTPTAVLIPTGVGAFAAAAVNHYRQSGRASHPAVELIAVEPVDAACVRLAFEAGDIVELVGEQESIMAGLNCGMASPVVLPTLLAGIDSTVTVDNDDARDAIRTLAGLGIQAGESAAASLAGARVACDQAGWDHATTLLLLSTEGPTDPVAWEQIVGRPPTDD